MDIMDIKKMATLLLLGLNEKKCKYYQTAEHLPPLNYQQRYQSTFQQLIQTQTLHICRRNETEQPCNGICDYWRLK